MFTNEYLLRCGEVYSVKLKNDCRPGDLLQFDCEKFSFTMKACGDCCSRSWFIQDDLNSFQLLGKTITSFVQKNLEDVVIDEGYSVLRDKVYIMTLNDGSDFEFIMRNDSNGQYNGWVEVVDFVEDSRNENENEISIVNSTAQAVIILGLPYSKKIILYKTKIWRNKVVYYI